MSFGRQCSRPFDEEACRKLALRATNFAPDPVAAAKAVDDFSAGLAIGATFDASEEARAYLLSFVMEAIDAIELRLSESSSG